MYLKQKLKKNIRDEMSGLLVLVDLLDLSLDTLKRVNTSNANYVVALNSLWAREGEKSTKTEHEGSLQEAIEKAEAEFKTTNKRSDVQADYDVRIVLGELKYQVPKEYWVGFKHYKC